jgi:hypothetical protein
VIRAQTALGVHSRFYGLAIKRRNECEGTSVSLSPIRKLTAISGLPVSQKVRRTRILLHQPAYLCSNARALIRWFTMRFESG